MLCNALLTALPARFLLLVSYSFVESLTDKLHFGDIIINFAYVHRMLLLQLQVTPMCGLLCCKTKHLPNSSSPRGAVRTILPSVPFLVANVFFGLIMSSNFLFAADSFSNMDPAVEGSVADSEFTDNQSPKPAYEFSDSGKSGDSENGFMGFVKGVKIKVKGVKIKVNDMMSSLSDYFQSLFGGPTEEKVSGDADAKPPFGEKAMGASLLGLAVMVIMVVVLKRV